MLRFENVTTLRSTTHGEVRILDRLSLEVKAGEFVVLRGPSGCGKTTLLLTAAGMLRPTSGRVTVDGQDLYALSGRERNRFRGQHVGFVFQMFHLLPYLNVRENILLAANANRGNASATRERARDLVKRLGLEPREQHSPAALSTGERQRTAIARALLNQPKLLLADEPTGNLDEDNAQIVFGYLSQYVDDGGCVLLVTHDARAAEHATRTLQMREGQIVDQ
jgi:putative ABC transport system ATP-binding protein